MTDLTRTLKAGQRITVRGPKDADGVYTSLRLVELKAGDRLTVTQEGTAPEPEPTPTPTPEPQPTSGLLTSAAELASLPTSGTAWTYMKSVADSSWGAPTVTDQNSKHGVKVLAGALVAARTGDAAMKSKVAAALKAVESVQISIINGGELAVARNLGAWVMAADLIGYRTPAFEAKLLQLLTQRVDDHSIWNVVERTAEVSGNNHGTFCLSSVLAFALYTKDQARIDKCWAIFRRYSDPAAPWTQFAPTSDYRSKGHYWQEGGQYVPINPASGSTKDGCTAEEASRSAGSTLDSAGKGYSLEAMQCFALQSILLSRAGLPAWDHASKAIKRAGDWSNRNAVLTHHSVGYHVAWVLNRFAGTSYPTQVAGYGRLLGYTDWLYG